MEVWLWIFLEFVRQVYNEVMTQIQSRNGRRAKHHGTQPKTKAKRDGKRNITLEVHIDQFFQLFYGTSIAALLPPPTPKSEGLSLRWISAVPFPFPKLDFFVSRAEHMVRQIYQDMADGLPLRQPLRPPGRIKLFWTRDNAHREDD